MKTKTEICPPQRRQAVLTERRRLKMACSAHGYVRGSTLKFYEWLDSAAGNPCRRVRPSGSAAIATWETWARWPTPKGE
jgi:hypothetical protein